MKIFDSDPDQGVPPLFLVLDPADGETAERELAQLRGAFAKIQLDLTDVPWGALRDAMHDLPATTDDSSARGEETTSHGTALVLTREGSGAIGQVLGKVERSDGPSTFIETAATIARETHDPRLAKSVGKLREVVEGGGAHTKSAADYFTSFMPSDASMRGAPAGALRRILDSVTVALSRLFAAFTVGTQALWDVLRDPDAFYLRLRGAVAEYARTRRSPTSTLADAIMLVPDLFRLFVRLLFDARVSVQSKAAVVSALVYLVTPFDLIPEALLGPEGYSDDVFVLALQILSLLEDKALNPGLLRDHWSGTDAQLEFVLALPARFAKSRVFAAIRSWWLSRSVATRR